MSSRLKGGPGYEDELVLPHDAVIHPDILRCHFRHHHHILSNAEPRIREKVYRDEPRHPGTDGISHRCQPHAD